MLKAVTLIVFASILVVAGPAHPEEPAETVRKGAPAYRLCAACHSLQPGVHLSGPSLAEVWGRPAGTVADFGRYTGALKKSDIVWDENTLNAWLADPQAMVPGTTMTFRGIKDNTTRSNLIAFLEFALAPGGVTKAVQNGLLSQQMVEGQIPPDLSGLGANQRVRDIRHCRDAYVITTADGAQFPFWETNVRIKTDSSPRGPKPGEPVLVRSGMAGDRVSVVFSTLADVHRLIAEQC